MTSYLIGFDETAVEMGISGGGRSKPENLKKKALPFCIQPTIWRSKSAGACPGNMGSDRSIA